MHKYKFHILNFKFQIKKESVSISVYLWTIALICCFLPLRQSAAQVRPVYDYGAIGLAQDLSEVLDNLTMYYQSEKLKEATATP